MKILSINREERRLYDIEQTLQKLRMLEERLEEIKRQKEHDEFEHEMMTEKHQTHCPRCGADIEYQLSECTSHWERTTAYDDELIYVLHCPHCGKHIEV